MMEKDPVSWHKSRVVGDRNHKRRSRQCPRLQVNISDKLRNEEKCCNVDRTYLVTGGAAQNMSTADMVISGRVYSKTQLWQPLIF